MIEEKGDPDLSGQGTYVCSTYVCIYTARMCTKYICGYIYICNSVMSPGLEKWWLCDRALNQHCYKYWDL